MLRNYLKIAWRNLMKNKTFSFINIFGLSAGLACCMLIALYLVNELSYDRYHKNGDSLYQMGTVFKLSGKEETWAATPSPMAAAVKREFPEVAESARLMKLLFEDKTLIQYNVPGAPLVSFYESNGFLADPAFFRMFTYQPVEGDLATALKEPLTVVLSEELARKLFGNQPALNKVIHISGATNGDHNFKVTGVFRPVNKPSHIDGKFFLSMTGGDMEGYMKQQINDFATNNIFTTYLQLKPGSDPKKLEAKFPAFIDKYAGKDLKAMGFEKRQFLVPVKDIHLRSDILHNVSPPGSKTYLYILASVALFTLLIACINFMNLATARSSKRSAEVGVRKVLGAEKKFLIGQFLGESVMMSLIAFLFACVFSWLLLPLFSSMTGKTLSLSFPLHLPLIAGFFALAIFTGLLAGIYPAFYLSSFRPVQVLKGKFTNSLAAVSFRKALVVFQFIISVVLIVSTTVINNQMKYLRSRDLGFEKSGQIIIPLRSQTAKQLYPALKTEFSKSREVAGVGASFYYPGILNLNDNLFYREGQNSQEAKHTRMNVVDAGFLQALGIKPVAGRLFSEAFPGDTSNRIILNENAIQSIGFRSPQEAIGKKVFAGSSGNGFEIVGVVKDFNFEDLHLPISPYGFQRFPNPNFSYLLVHAATGETKHLLSSLKTTWQRLNPGEPFEYSFLDEDFQQNYKAEERLSAMIGYFTVMAILISCLGLFGLASFSAEQRVKEIGVRKVLGASVMSIVSLLSKDFLKLVIVAVIIASPIAWFVMNKWLQEFAYRTSISAWVFLATTVIAFFIALFTISFQAIRAGLANPVKSLRTE